MSNVSIPVLATSVLLAAFSAFGASYLMSPPPVRSGDSRPIIDPDAWNKGAPVSQTFQAQLNTSPVAVNISAAADDLNQRGWVPPDDAKATSYQDNIQPIDVSDRSYSGSYSIEQLDGAGPAGDKGISSITVLDKAEADRAWDSEPASTVSQQ